MTRNILLLSAALSPCLLQAQLLVDNTQSPSQLVQNVLTGGGVTISNVSFNDVAAPGAAQAGTGAFTANGTNLGLNAGIVLSSGNVGLAPGTAASLASGVNNSGSDADLLAISGAAAINDRAVLEFDFVPTGNQISFNFVFGSEEYPAFVCNFNDAFGFFLSGPGINGPFGNNAKNIAVLPGTPTPVTIGNVNNGANNNPNDGACPAVNPQFYVDNTGGNTIAYNGFTTVLQARSDVQCGQTYHIKLAIGDAGDSGFDSAVFIDAGSFSSPPISLVMPADITVPCMDAVDVTVQNVQGGNAPFSFQWSSQGAAQGNGQTVSTAVDAPRFMVVNVSDACGASATDSILVSPMPFSLIMPQDQVLACLTTSDLDPQLQQAGQNADLSFVWTSNGTNAGNAPTLSITAPAQPTQFDLTVTDVCGSSASGSVGVSTQVLPPMGVNVSEDVTVFCTGDNVTVQMISALGGQAPYAMSWIDADGSELSEAASLTVAVPTDATYTLTITDVCGNTANDAVNTLVPHYDPLTVVLTPDQLICLGNSAELVADPAGGSGLYTFSWSPFAGTDSIATVSPGTPTTFTVQVTEFCGATTTAQVLVDLEIPVVNIVASNIQGDEWSFSAFSQPSANSFDWQFDDGTESTLSNPTHAYLDLQDHMPQVTITTANGCTATDTVHVATESHLFLPNAFTPDGDGINDTFGPVGNDLGEFEMTIFDRWGAEVCSLSGVGQVWDGRMKNGEMAPQAVYVYRYRASGERMPVTEGLGHVTLLGEDTAQK